jgi:hypothetical protein
MPIHILTRTYDSSTPLLTSSSHKLKRLYTNQHPCSQTKSRPTTSRETTYRHDKTRNAHVRAQAFADARTLPDGPDEVVVLAAVDYAREDVVRVRRRADEEEQDDEERLEVEQGGLET